MPKYDFKPVGNSKGEGTMLLGIIVAVIVVIVIIALCVG
jgi:hypothetical protein